MNRKGDAFLVILDILFLAAIVLIFAKLSVAFTQQNPGESIGTRQAALLHTYAISEQMLLYVDEAAQFAAYEALATTMRDGMKLPQSNCQQYATYTLWTSPEGGCMPSVDAASRTSVYGAFERALQSELCRYLRYPGFPGYYYSDLNFQNYAAALTDYAPHFGRSFVYAGLATLFAFLISYPLAYAMAFKAGRWRNLMLICVIAPLAVSMKGM